MAGLCPCCEDPRLGLGSLWSSKGDGLHVSEGLRRPPQLCHEVEPAPVSVAPLPCWPSSCPRAAGASPLLAHPWELPPPSHLGAELQRVPCATGLISRGLLGKGLAPPLPLCGACPQSPERCPLLAVLSWTMSQCDSCRVAPAARQSTPLTPLGQRWVCQLGLGGPFSPTSGFARHRCWLCALVWAWGIPSTTFLCSS